jgi:PAS domain S-box-containing protein
MHLSNKNITTNHKLNRQLEEKENYLVQLISQAPDAIIVIDELGMIQLWNPKAENIFGWESKEVIGSSLVDIIIPSEKKESYTQKLNTFLSIKHSSQGYRMNNNW